MWKTYLQTALVIAIVWTAWPEGVRATTHVIPNPIAAQSVEALILSVAGALAYLAMIAGTVAIVWVGFKFVVAASTGDEAGVTASKKLLWQVLLGVAIVVGASTLVRVVLTTIRGL